jgi:hypothetical protein
MRAMIQGDSPLRHHLIHVPIAERIAQIPKKAEDDDRLESVAPKQCRPLVLHSFNLPDRTQRVCDRSIAKLTKDVFTANLGNFKVVKYP